MKKVLSCFLVLTMLLSLCSWGLAEAYNEYTATAQGYGGELSVTLTLDGNRIYAVEVKGDSETQGIGSNAIDALPQAMVDSNSVVVDTFSGATFTSKAILEAAAAALAQAGLTNDDLEKAEPTETAVVHEDMTCVILVLGGGGTGLVAAVSAIENGADPARVVVVEKTGVFGGTSATAGAVLTGPLTRFMKSQGDFNPGAGCRFTPEFLCLRSVKGAADHFRNNVPLFVEESILRFHVDVIVDCLKIRHIHAAGDLGPVKQLFTAEQSG